MAEHDIFLAVPRHDVQYADVTFEIRSDGELLGILGISRGTLAWTPSRARETRHVDWEQLTPISEDWARHSRAAQI